MLLTDHYDQTFYAVRAADGRLLDGDQRLPLAPETRRSGEIRYYFDARLDHLPIRVAALERELAGQKLTILAGETMVKRNALIREILLGMLLPELLLVALSLLIVWFGVRSGLRPLDGLRHELAGRSHTDLSPLGTDVPQEMQPMVQEINGLLQRLADSLDSQRNFVSDAAHQLRTPIAALQAQVEAALRDAPETARAQLSGVRNACQRLAHLVSQLLALARAEPSLAQTDPEIELAEIIHACAETWLPNAIARGIDLGFEVAPLRVHGNRLLLQELLGNLIDNALRHAPDGGAVTVGCRADGADRCWLTVEDNGPGIRQRRAGKDFRTLLSPARQPQQRLRPGPGDRPRHRPPARRPGLRRAFVAARRRLVRRQPAGHPDPRARRPANAKKTRRPAAGKAAPPAAGPTPAPLQADGVRCRRWFMFFSRSAITRITWVAKNGVCWTRNWKRFSSTSTNSQSLSANTEAERGPGNTMLISPTIEPCARVSTTSSPTRTSALPVASTYIVCPSSPSRNRACPAATWTSEGLWANRSKNTILCLLIGFSRTARSAGKPHSRTAQR